MPGTVAVPKPTPAAADRATADPGWKVVLHNDDVTPMEVVILGLQRAAGLSLEVAEMVTLEAHRSGSAVARSGLSQDDAELICIKLRQLTRITGLCPGVVCEALKDA